MNIIKIKKLSEDDYYDLMCGNMGTNFTTIHDNWLACFTYWLGSLKVGFSDKAIVSLFYDFEMMNWKAMHKENSPEYKDHTKKELIDSFIGECSYSCDRMSYDRLFRTHWLFLQAFPDEMNGVRYPDLYDEKVS